MRRLILLRHAKSDWPDGVADPERPLAPRGRTAAPRIGIYIAREELVADRVLVSPARRTRETWDLVAAQLPPVKVVASEPRIYDASASRLLSVLREQPRDAHSLMLVGHNPGLEDLAEMLAAGGSATYLSKMSEKFPTGALAVIDLPVDDWSLVAPGSGRLDRFVTPRDLPGAD
ncbi:histidine phosphatase family protein [Xanthobacter dioxanivorans]|uniref:Histidine phosphatase family protein n=1 Tax=Xanthobacter dioxanivorans TaxID=2528964 RepID=A0A974PKZ1_9HYPH|nr:histidine phosphatase family protein [Xanthobacter dioxanivorans]QRG05459.1 histidine phosphatase family protein [Xanthobacter dioxanivorans]